MGWESSDVVRFDLGPLLQGQMRITKHGTAYNSLIIGPRGLQCETNWKEIMGWKPSSQIRIAKSKSSYKSPIISPRGLQFEINLWEVMGWESSDVGPLLQGQMRIAKVKSACNLLILGPRGLQCTPTNRKSWGKNLLMWSDLTLGSSFKVKWWVNWLWWAVFLVHTICIGSPMC